MRLIVDLAHAAVEQPTIVTIGAFDGLHIGHRRLVEQLVARTRGKGTLSTVVTFHPHPRAVLRPWLGPKVLTTPGEKAALLAEMGLDVLVLLRFNAEMAGTPAPEFVQLLSQHLRMAELWVGHDFALGHGRQGNVVALRDMGARWGFEVMIVEPVVANGRIVSSTWVRELLATGQVAQARRLLGRPYSLVGEVVGGARRGRCLGYPTANLAVRTERALPPDGVYTVYARIDDRQLPALANIGERPSFDKGRRAIEVHVLDYSGDLYGRDLLIEFVDRLRAERRFCDVCELVRQISRDVERARDLFATDRERDPQPDEERLP